MNFIVILLPCLFSYYQQEGHISAEISTILSTTPRHVCQLLPIQNQPDFAKIPHIAARPNILGIGRMPTHVVNTNQYRVLSAKTPN